MTRAWQGLRVEHPGWPPARVVTSRPELFAVEPRVDGSGTLIFVLRNASDVLLPACYRTCVLVASHARPARMLQIWIERDPCGAASSCRSLYFSSQFACEVGSEWARIFERFDGWLSWGMGKSIAFLGGARSPDVRASPPLPGKASNGISKRSSFAKGVDNGGEAATEPLMKTPEWQARVAPIDGGRRKASGGASFLPASRQSTRLAGRHEYHVAWLAVQDSGFVHRRCSEADGSDCDSDDASAALQRRFSVLRGASAGDIVASYHRATKRMCGSSERYARRPTFLAFGARASFLQFYGGARSRAGLVSRRARLKDDHYIGAQPKGSNANHESSSFLRPTVL